MGAPLLLASIVAWIFPVGVAKAFIGARKIAAPAIDAATNSRRLIGINSLLSKVSVEAHFAAEILCVNTPSAILLVEVPRPRSCLLSEFLAGDISKKESWK